MRTGEVVEILRKQGFEVTPGYLDFLFRELHLPRPPLRGSRLDWRQADVQRLKAVLARRGRAPIDAERGKV